MGLFNEITNRTTILQRGSLLIASIDLFQSAVMLFVMASTIITTSCYSPGNYSYYNYWVSDLYCRTLGVYVFAVALVQIIQYALGVALSFGVRNKRAKMVKIWLYPNCIIIGIVGVIAMILVVTPLAVYAPLLSMLLVFRAFQCWIVAEMLYNDLVVNAIPNGELPDTQQL